MAHDQPMVQFWGHKTYRAVFAHPNSDYLERGEEVDTLKEALETRPRRSEETHAYLIGIESRVISAWEPMPLTQLMESKT